MSNSVTTYSVTTGVAYISLGMMFMAWLDANAGLLSPRGLQYAALGATFMLTAGLYGAGMALEDEFKLAYIGIKRRVRREQ